MLAAEFDDESSIVVGVYGVALLSAMPVLELAAGTNVETARLPVCGRWLRDIPRFPGAVGVCGGEGVRAPAGRSQCRCSALGRAGTRGDGHPRRCQRIRQERLWGSGRSRTRAWRPGQGGRADPTNRGSEGGRPAAVPPGAGGPVPRPSVRAAGQVGRRRAAVQDRRADLPRVRDPVLARAHAARARRVARRAGGDAPRPSGSPRRPVLCSNASRRRRGSNGRPGSLPWFRRDLSFVWHRRPAGGEILQRVRRRAQRPPALPAEPPTRPGASSARECGTQLGIAGVGEPERTAPAAERRLVSVLFADLVGFTAALRVARPRGGARAPLRATSTAASG